MTAPDIRDPIGRALAEIARPFDALPLRSLWLATIPLFHVDAPTRIRRRPMLGQLARAVLSALSPTAPLTLEDLDRRLGLGRAFLGRLLAQLRSCGLVGGSDEGACLRSPAGSSALQDEPVEWVVRGRFHFVKRPPPLPPHFLRLTGGTPRVSRSTPEETRFQPHWLVDCFKQLDDWKSRHHFPRDIQAVEASCDPLARWIIVRGEELETVLAEAEWWSGYDAAAVRTARERPAAMFQLAAEAFLETFKGVWREPTLNDWQQAWREWCQARGVGESEAAACQLHLHGLTLIIYSPDILQSRLEAYLGGANCWLAAGSGAFQRLAQLVFHFFSAGQ